jgi:hypothetical protein
MSSNHKTITVYHWLCDKHGFASWYDPDHPLACRNAVDKHRRWRGCKRIFTKEPYQLPALSLSEALEVQKILDDPDALALFNWSAGKLVYYTGMSEQHAKILLARAMHRLGRFRMHDADKYSEGFKF